MKKDKVQIGFVGLSFSNFQSAEYGIYEESCRLLESMSEELDFELIAYPVMVQDSTAVTEACKMMESSGVDFLMLQASSLMLGDIIEPFGDICSRIGFWLVPEPTLKGELPLNSLTGFNLGVSILRKKYPNRPVKWFYGSPAGDTDFVQRFLITIRALRALKNLQGSRICMMNDVVPTFINLTYEEKSLKKHLGVDIVTLALEDLFTRVSAGKEAERIEKEMRQAAKEVRVPVAELGKSAGIADALLSIAAENKFDALALRCWPEFQDVMYTAPCASVAYLNDHGLITSCEGDLPGAISMLAALHISGETPTMNDPVALDMERDLIQMWHCGPGPASWADENGQVLDWHHTLNRRVKDGDPKFGVSSDIAFKSGAVTLLHVSGDGSSLFVMEGEVVEGPEKPYPGSGGWLGNLSSGGISCTASDFLENITDYGFEHHYPIMRGHHEASIRELASWAGLEVLELRKATSYVQRFPGPRGGIRQEDHE